MVTHILVFPWISGAPEKQIEGLRLAPDVASPLPASRLTVQFWQGGFR